MTSPAQHETEPASNPSASKPERPEPSLRESVLLWSITAIIFIATTSLFSSYRQLLRNFGDSAAYIQIADAIRHWDFSSVQVKHFWGLPYAMALLGKLTGISSQTALFFLSCVTSLAALLLARRLWGGWIAVYALLLNFDWYQRSFLGGSEPLFVALVFGSFLAIREEKWTWAALLASFATITRPLGICLLVGIGVSLVRRRAWGRLGASVGLALVVGFLYVVPLRLYLHDPLATVHSYGVLQSTEYPSLFGIPFYAIIVGTLRYPAPATNLVFSLAWIALVLAGNFAMLATEEFRQYARTHLAEIVFAALYLLAIYSYNLPAWARSNFPRFAIPVLPFIFLALKRWLPKDRRAVWCLTLTSSVLAACSAIGIQNVIAALHRR